MVFICMFTYLTVEPFEHNKRPLHEAAAIQNIQRQWLKQRVLVTILSSLVGPTFGLPRRISGKDARQGRMSGGQGGGFR